jgi:hypothetical protein
MQHIKAALRHRVFRDNLLANATPSMAAKYRDFESRPAGIPRPRRPKPTIGRATSGFTTLPLLFGVPIGQNMDG